MSNQIHDMSDHFFYHIKLNVLYQIRFLMYHFDFNLKLPKLLTFAVTSQAQPCLNANIIRLQKAK
jgi:hypothetical protein